MIQKVTIYSDLYKIQPFFQDIRFHMGRSVLDGVMGEAYTDNILNPQVAFLVAKSYCFISGSIKKEKLKDIIEQHFKNFKLIPSDSICRQIEELYHHNIVQSQRYSIKKEVTFDIIKLEKMSNTLETDFSIIKIDDFLADRIKKEKFINITDNYKKYGIGFCCLYHNKIVGVASSNIIYKDGIEVNIRVSEPYRRKGIATAMASHLILECLKQNKKISWDASNINSVKLAEKLGFQYNSTYNIYYFSKD